MERGVVIVVVLVSVLLCEVFSAVVSGSDNSLVADESGITKKMHIE